MKEQSPVCGQNKRYATKKKRNNKLLNFIEHRS